MTQVFVSYSRKDIEFAKRLTAELKKCELDFWIDWEGIPPTVDWWREIEKGIEGADVFLFLISPDSSASNVCGREIDTAVKNAKRIIPLVVRDIKGDEAPKQLSHLNWIFVRETDDFDVAFQKLLTGIHTDYEWVQQHRWLQVRALDWQRDNKDNSSLLRGKDLQDAEYQLATNSSKEPHPTDLQREYVFESRKATDRQKRMITGISIAGVIALAALAIFGIAKAIQATANATEANRQAAMANAASTLASNNAATAQANASIARIAEVDAKNQKATAVANEQIARLRQWAAEANVILGSPNGNAETAALISLHALRANYSPEADAALVASLNRLYTAKVFDKHEASVSVVAYSPKGDQIAIGYVDGTAGLYDVATGNEIRSFDGFSDRVVSDPNPQYEGVHALTFSADGNLLLIAGSDGHILIWNRVTGSPDIDFVVPEPISWNLPLWSAKFSPDENNILIATGYPYYGYDAGNIYLLDRKTGNLKYTFPEAHTRFVSDVEVSQDGKFVLSTSFDRTAILWDMNWKALTATPRKAFETAMPIRDGALSTDGNFVLLGEDNNIAELYSMEKNSNTDRIPKMKFIGHTDSIFSVNFSPIEGYVLTGSLDGTARLWDIATGKTVRVFVNQKGWVVSTAFSPDGNFIITGSYDKTATLWYANPFHDARTIYGHADRINSVSYSPDGSTILSASRDNRVLLWNSKTLEADSSLKLSPSLLDPKAVFSATGKWIAAASEAYEHTNPTVVFWEKNGAGYSEPTVVQTDHVTSLAFSPEPDTEESQYFLTSNESGEIDLWNIRDGIWNNEIPLWGGPSFPTVMFTSDSKYIASVNGPISIIDIQNPDKAISGCVAELASGDSEYRSSAIAFSPDTKYLAVQVNQEIVILDWKTNPQCNEVTKLAEHSAQVSHLLFSPKGHYLLSTSLDGTAILWDAKTWQKIRTLTGHQGDITSAAFSPDELFIVTGGADRTIRIWDTDYENTIDKVCSLLAKDLTDEERVKYGIDDDKQICSNFQ